MYNLTRRIGWMSSFASELTHRWVLTIMATRTARRKFMDFGAFLSPGADQDRVSTRIRPQPGKEGEL